MTAGDHLGWIRTGLGGYGDLGIRKKQTNISVNESTSCFMGSVPGSS